MSQYFVGLAVLALALISRPCEAAEITKHESDNDTVIILISGQISSGDVETFKAIAAQLSTAIVLLDSNGGATLPAIEIGETIRLKGFSTVVINGSTCNSACALIWLAGTPRAISKSAKVGFHASYLESGGNKSESGVGNAVVGRYLTLLNLPLRAVIFATSAAPDSANWLTSSNYETVGIEARIVDDLTDDEEKTAGNDDEKSSTSWKDMPHWSVLVDNTLDRSCFAISVFPDETIFRIGFNYKKGGSHYVILSNSAWTSLKTGQTHELKFTFAGETPWAAPASVRFMGKQPSLMVTFSDTTFFSEYASATSLKIETESREVANLNLKGSAEALNEMIDCQKEQNRTRRIRDPFAD